MSGRSYFVSYSRSDERFALRLAADLQARDVTVWVDQLDIRPSEHWDRAIERAVRDCSGLIVLLSPRSVASENVADEISFAIDSGKQVLPILIEKCSVPLRVTRMHLIDATGDYDRALAQCVVEVRRSAAGPVPAAAIPLPAVCIDRGQLAVAERQLTALVGPIATVLTAQAAARAGSVAELYALLAPRVADAADRERFRASAPGAAAISSAAPPAVAPADPGAALAADVEALGRVLTAFLGPIAPLVARREGQAATSLDDLRQRLGALIPADRDRATFLQRATAHQPNVAADR